MSETLLLPPTIGPRREGAERQGEAASNHIRILSYNVLGARQGLADKHDHVGVDVSYKITAAVATEGLFLSALQQLHEGIIGPKRDKMKAIFLGGV